MCSTLIFGKQMLKYLAQNYDHSLTHGLVAVNLRGTHKENGRQPGEKALRWTVAYGSVTFNQFSLELPASGMNEKGLSIALMWHYGGDFGQSEGYARLSALQWIQYHLDTCQNVNEVLANLERVRPKQEGFPLHFSLLDAQGQSLLLEFIDGEPQVYLNPEVPILTNSTYATCLRHAQSEQTLPEEIAASEHSSVARFVHLYRQYPKLQRSVPSQELGFQALQSVSQTPGQESFPWDRGETNPVEQPTETSSQSQGQSQTCTAWSIVFHPQDKSIAFKTDANPALRQIQLADLDFAPSAEYLLMEINEGQAGTIAPCLRPYSQAENRAIVSKTAQVFGIPKPEQEGLIEVVDRLYQQRAIQLG